MRNSKKMQVIGTYAALIENYILPWIAVWALLQNLRTIHSNRVGIWVNLNKLIQGGVNPGEALYLFSFNLCFILAIYNFCFAIGFLVRKRSRQEFTRLSEIILPIACVLFFVLFNLLSYLPKGMHIHLIPKTVYLPSLIIGFSLSMLGALLSSIGVLNLKDSFSILVEAQTLRTNGLYSITRHPIYFGHFLRTLGASLMCFHLFYVILGVSFVYLLVRRALLEEERMMRHNPEYQDYMHKTPSFFLKLFAADRHRIG